jgi:DNA-binding transcriptional MocR family regulator
MTESIDRGESPYLQIARHYREKIESGELQPGQLLPSVRAMADRTGADRDHGKRLSSTILSQAERVHPADATSPRRSPAPGRLGSEIFAWAADLASLKAINRL